MGLQKSEIKNGTKVWTDTHGVYQETQESLSRLTGIIVNDTDVNNIHVKLDGKEWEPIGFSYWELSTNKPTKYVNENL